MSKKKLLLVTILSLLVLSLAIYLSLRYGSRAVSMHDFLLAFSDKADVPFETSVIRTRIPRTVFGVIAGAGLGVSGVVMQSITRNPLADPSILGINTGASLFVVIGMAFFGISSANQYIWLALLGAGLTSVFVYAMANIGASGMTPVKLALAGTATSISLNSLVSTIMMPRTQVMDQFRFWQVGSIGASSVETIQLALPFIIIGFIIAIIMSPSLNTLALGDDMATSLGLNVNLVRGISAISSVLLCGSITALAGPIGFVGLMVPHFIRLIFGSDMRYMIPFSAIGGAILLVLSDVLGRVLTSPGDIEVGIITAFIGAPIFILAVRKAKVRSL